VSSQAVVVLNTRPTEQAGELSRLLAVAGFDVVEAPAISIVAAWDPDELLAVRRDLAAGAFDWVILASQNAARGLESELRSARVVCGAATAAAVGLQADIALERFGAAAALEALRDRVKPGQRVLVPRAAEGRDELIEGVSLLGAIVVAPMAYCTVPVNDAASRLRAGGVDVVVLCSPSAVISVASAVQPDTRVVCLGQTTASAATAAALRVDAVARSTSMAALVDAVRALAVEAHV